MTDPLPLRNPRRPCAVWLTGISGAGKSTLGIGLVRELRSLGYPCILLDGDQLRQGLNADLGFGVRDRTESVRRTFEVAWLVVESGVIAVVAAISPFRAQRNALRQRLRPGEFLEVFVDTPLEVAEARDPKGLYQKARRGELRDFTGIDSPYEPPDAPDLVIDTVRTSAEDGVRRLVALLRARAAID